MDAVEYVKQRKRMCDYYIACDDCPAFGSESCSSLDSVFELVEIVEQWAKEHPVKTRQSEFLKMLPEAEIGDDGLPSVAPCQLYKDMEEKDENGVCCKNCGCAECRHDFWLKEVHENKED